MFLFFSITITCEKFDDRDLTAGGSSSMFFLEFDDKRRL